MSMTTLNHPATNRTPVFDANLVSRYAITGPRYTSYPTALQFAPDFGESALREIARASNEDPIPRALSVYVHVPFCLSPRFHCRCARVITRDRARAETYLEHLLREIELTAPLFDSDRLVVQLHLGGGAPNFLDTRQMIVLVDSLRRGFSLAGDSAREFGIEVDPRYADAEMVHMLAGLGFNRISLGIQDFDADVQAAVNRVQSVEQTRRVIEAARESGFRSIGVDLIHGLPKQTPERFARTLAALIALRPDRVATYAYAHMPKRFRAQRRILALDVPNAPTRLALIGLSVEMLGAAGYRYIGLDHFALPSDDLAHAQRNGTMQRNFQGYSTHADCDLIGLGVSSVGHVGRSFHQNARDLPTYYAAIASGHLPVQRGMLLDDDDVIRADAISRIMCDGALDVNEFEQHHDIEFARYFTEELKRLSVLAGDGLVALTAQRIEVSARGRFLLRIVAMCFDAYLHGAGADRSEFSAVI